MRRHPTPSLLRFMIARLLNIEGAVDVEGLSVEAPADSRGGGVVDAAGEAQAVYALAQVLDDGEPQGAFRAAVHIGLALCGRVEHGLVTTCIVEAHRLDGFVVVNARSFSDGIELTDGVGEDLGEGVGLCDSTHSAVCVPAEGLALAQRTT